MILGSADVGLKGTVVNRIYHFLKVSLEILSTVLLPESRLKASAQLKYRVLGSEPLLYPKYYNHNLFRLKEIDLLPQTLIF